MCRNFIFLLLKSGALKKKQRCGSWQESNFTVYSPGPTAQPLDTLQSTSDAILEEPPAVTVA